MSDHSSNPMQCAHKVVNGKCIWCREDRPELLPPAERVIEVAPQRNFEVFCGVPDRVIDAPIPDHLLRIGNDVHHPDVCDCDLVGLQDRCKIQPPLESVGDWIKRLIDIAARLEAEKQDAHTEGWNAAIEKCASGLRDKTSADLLRCLSKPTAAKQGEPS